MSENPQPINTSFTVRIGPRAQKALHGHVDLQMLGMLVVRTDEIGRNYINLPAPFESLRIFDGESLSVKKARRLAEALQHFGAGVTLQEPE